MKHFASPLLLRLCWLAPVLLLAATLGAPAHASAQETPPADPDTAEEDPARVEEALVMYERARERYEAGDFERSVLLLEEALVLHDAPELHYNLARALSEVGRWEEARNEYAIYRDRAPESSMRERVDARIEQLDQRLAAQAEERAERERQASPPPPPPEPASPFDPAPWVVLGGGAAVAAVGIPFGVLFVDAENTAANAPDHEAAFGPANDATSYAILANVMFGVGAVTGIIGLVWGLVSLADE